MAAVLDSLAAPLAAARPSPPQLRSLSSLHGGEGLRVGRGFQKWALSSSATGSPSERLNLARRRLVCEAKEAAVEGERFLFFRYLELFPFAFFSRNCDSSISFYLEILNLYVRICSSLYLDIIIIIFVGAVVISWQEDKCIVLSELLHLL